MESHAKYALVGSIVVVFTIMIVAFVLWLSEVGSHRQAKMYTVYFREHSLDGLQADSDVTMKGIKVGTVLNYQISEKDIERVKVRLKLNEKTPIKLDTRAVLRRNMLTGLATIDLIGSSQSSLILEQILEGEEDPVILEGRTDFDALAASIPDLMADVGEMMQRAGGFFSQENKVALGDILANLSKFTDVLAQKDESIVGMVDDVTKLAQELQSISESLNSVADNVDVQIKRVGEELARALAQITDTTETVNNRADDVATSVTNAARVITLQTDALTQDISRAANSISAAVEKFEDPKALISKPTENVLGPGEGVLQ